jgi:hypothetical protein
MQHARDSSQGGAVLFVVSLEKGMPQPLHINEHINRMAEGEKWCFSHSKNRKFSGEMRKN